MSGHGVGDVSGNQPNDTDYSAAMNEVRIRFGIEQSQIDHPGLISVHEEMAESTNPGREFLQFIGSRRSAPLNMVYEYRSYLLALSYAQIASQLQREADDSADLRQKTFLENAARNARLASLMLSRGKADMTTVDAFIGIRSNLRNPTRRTAGIHLLNFAVENGPNNETTVNALENFVGALWEGFNAADWQGILQWALEKATGKYDFVPNTDLTFTTDAPWVEEEQITSPRQWAASLPHELHHLSGLRTGRSVRSLLTLLLNGEKRLFELLRDLKWFYREQGDEGAEQLRALTPLILVAASRELSDARRNIVETAALIIDSEEFRTETTYRQTLREIVDNVIVFLSYPELNPKIEREVASIVMSLYGRRTADSRQYEIGNVLMMLKPLIDPDYQGKIAGAESLEDLANMYAKEHASGAGPAPSGESRPSLVPYAPPGPVLAFRLLTHLEGAAATLLRVLEVEQDGLLATGSRLENMMRYFLRNVADALPAYPVIMTGSDGRLLPGEIRTIEMPDSGNVEITVDNNKFTISRSDMAPTATSHDEYGFATGSMTLNERTMSNLGPFVLSIASDGKRFDIWLNPAVVPAGMRETVRLALDISAAFKALSEGMSVSFERLMNLAETLGEQLKAQKRNGPASNGSGGASGGTPTDSGAPPAPAAPAPTGSAATSAAEDYDYQITAAFNPITAADESNIYYYRPDDGDFAEEVGTDAALESEETVTDTGEPWTWSAQFYADAAPAFAAL